MKKFLLTLLASFLGVIAAFLIFTLFSISALGSLSSSLSKPEVIVPSSAILKIDFSEQLAEQTKESQFDLSSLTPSLPIANAEQGSTIGILQAVKAIEYAATDPAIKYIYLNTEKLNSGMTYVEELRAALERFRQSGKAIVSYSENFSNLGYYLASVSDKIYTHEFGTSNIIGISSSLLFLKDILDRAGVNVQLIRHGKYKSAGEMFISNNISDANREQNQAMVDGIWNNISAAICKSRGIDPKKFNDMVNNLEFRSNTTLKEAGLVDDIVTREDMTTKLCDLFGVDKAKELKMVSLSKYAKARIKPELKTKEKIAVVYANGDIAQGDGEGITSEKFVKIISDVRKDSTIKAVVLRVNSPGGDAIAAELIRNELILLKAQKPVIVSQGDYAASGGYWISANADKIFTNNMTLTGSIGVFSMIPDFGKIAKEKAHVNIVKINSNKHSDMLSLMRPLDATETAYFQSQIELVYDRFLGIVAEGRGITTDMVDNIAQGRVWVGSDALNINLSDAKGGIYDALNYAASAAGLEKYRLVEYPAVKSSMEKMMEMLGETGKTMTKLSEPERAIKELYLTCKENSSLTIARLPFIYHFE